MKRYILTIIGLIICSFLILSIYELYIDKKINSNYSDYVITNLESNIYKLNNNHLEKSGKVSKDIVLNLNGKYHKRYFRISDTSYYIKYDDVKAIDKKDDISIDKYVSNKMIKVNDTLKLYYNDNSYIELYDDNLIDLLQEKDNKYYVRFNNQIYYVDKDEKIMVIDNDNVINSTDYISVLYFEDISNEEVINKLEYLKNNNYLNITINDYVLWRKGLINLPENTVLIIVKDYFEQLDNYDYINKREDFKYKLINDNKPSSREIEDSMSNYIVTDETTDKQFDDMLLGKVIIIGPVATKVAVLNYHFFYDKSNNEWCNEALCLDIKDFEEQLIYLKNNEYKTLTMDEFKKWMYGEIDVPEKSVLLTIDDGAKGTDTHLIRLLEKYDMHGTLFLITAWWPKENYLSNNLEVESHGYDIHHSGYCKGVTRGAKGLCLSSEELLEDLNKSIEILNTNIAFCFPFYAYNESAISTVKEAGFKIAFVGGNRKATRDDDKYKIPRYPVYKYTSLSEFIDMIS